MYKKFSFIPKTFSISLNYTESGKETIIKFVEPTLYKILESEELLKEKLYYKSITNLWIEIDETVFLSNPYWILNGIFKLMKWENENAWDVEKSDWEAWFLSWNLDFLAKRWGVDPLYILKNYTKTQLASASKGVEFNNNIENDKAKENKIFKDTEKEKQINNEKEKEYENIIEQVRKNFNLK